MISSQPRKTPSSSPGHGPFATGCDLLDLSRTGYSTSLVCDDTCAQAIHAKACWRNATSLKSS